VIDPIAIHRVCRFLKKGLAQALQQTLLQVYEENMEAGVYKLDQESIGRRSLKNTCLSYLMELTDSHIMGQCVEQFYQSKNMTDTICALVAIANHEGDQREAVINDFYEKWKNDTLVIDKWFSIQATSSHADTFERVKLLTSHTNFSIKNPNKVRALIGAFSQGNQLHFHNVSGGAYSFLSDYVIEIDKLNPQLASRLVTGFSFWKRFDKKRQSLMEAELCRIKQSEHLSTDVYEIVTKSLN